MRQDPLLASIGAMLRRFRCAEAWLRKAGLPVLLARVPVWLLCLQYCIMMRGKTVRITRIAERIVRWLQTINQLAQDERARTELIDIDSGMRNDIESTKRTLLLLRELCVDVGGMFHSIGFKSAMLETTQENFLTVVDESCLTATTLQRALEMHDTRALALLREMAEAERADLEQADNRQTDIEQTDIEQADIEQADIEQADIEQAEQADIEQAAAGRVHRERANVARHDAEDNEEVNAPQDTAPYRAIGKVAAAGVGTAAEA